MFCNNCGQAQNATAQFCINCGTRVLPAVAPRRLSERPSAEHKRPGWYVWLAVGIATFGTACLGGIAVLGLLWISSSISRHDDIGKTESRIASSSAATEPTKVTAVVPRQGASSDAMKSARENYVTKTQEEFKTQGVDATISDLDGNLVVISDVLKLKPDRDKLMQTTFDVAYRKGLCSAGFKTVELGSSALFRYGDKYSLGCPETKEERASRIEAQKRDRQRFVDDLQKKFEGDPAGAIPIRVEQQGSELVLTGSGDEVPPAILRALLSTEIDNDTKVKLCSLGFHGARARSNSTSGGVFQSFNCSQHNAQ